jgi:hypothetical protein
MEHLYMASSILLNWVWQSRSVRFALAIGGLSSVMSDIAQTQL